MGDVMWPHTALDDPAFIVFEPLKFNSYGGGIHPQARIGGLPQHRGWRPGTPVIAPRVHRTARIEFDVTIDCGLERATLVDEGAWLMKYVHIGHDAVIGPRCEIAPHCSVGGHVELGADVRVGQGALFRPFVKVGRGARIGIGAVVVKDVDAGAVVAGNPARTIEHHRLTDADLESLLSSAATQ